MSAGGSSLHSAAAPRTGGAAAPSPVGLAGWLLPLAATVGAWALVRGGQVATAAGRPWPISGYLLALGLVSCAVLLALRLGTFDRAELAVPAGNPAWPFARMFLEGALFMGVVLAAVHALAPTFTDHSLHDVLQEVEETYGFRRILTWDLPGPQPWAWALFVPIEELLFRSLWLAAFRRRTRRAFLANLGQATLWALWHSVWFMQPQPEIIAAGVLYGEIIRLHGTVAATLGFHAGWNTALIACVLTLLS